MGFFWKTPKPNPKITVEGIEIVFQFLGDRACWQFTYRGTPFWSFETALTLPTKTELDSILDAVESLMPEMRTRIQKSLIEYDWKLDDGESYLVNIQDFAEDKTFDVSWSGGADWGDLGVDFTIKGNSIINEAWGD